MIKQEKAPAATHRYSTFSFCDVALVVHQTARDFKTYSVDQLH